jgi:hypothetical protein
MTSTMFGLVVDTCGFLPDARRSDTDGPTGVDLGTKRRSEGLAPG